MGLGKEGAETLSVIFHKNTRIKRVYLGQNNLGDDAIRLLDTQNIIHLDIGSNGISSAGCESIFKKLMKNTALVSLDISSKERRNMNKLTISSISVLSALLK
jgi:hypothetical protein